MEVILVKPVRKLGKIGEIVKVKNGFGRNYLIPQKLAIRAIESNKHLIEQQKSEFEAKNAQAKLDAEIVAKTIANKNLIFIRQAAEDGKLFGSVTNKEIAQLITQTTAHKVLYFNILLETSIKSLGVFAVEVMLHSEVIAPVIIAIARTEAEAEDALRTYKANAQDNQESAE